MIGYRKIFNLVSILLVIFILFNVYNKLDNKVHINSNDNSVRNTTKEYNVIYTDPEFKTIDDKTYTVNSGSKTPIFNKKLKKSGYIFVGWTPKRKKVVTENKVYKALWKEEKNNNGVEDDKEDKCKIIYIDGFSGEVFKDQVYYAFKGENIPRFKGDTPIKKGYRFVGWNNNYSGVVSRDLIITAKWEKLDNPTTHNNNLFTLVIISVISMFIVIAGIISRITMKQV